MGAGGVSKGAVAEHAGGGTCSATALAGGWTALQLREHAATFRSLMTFGSLQSKASVCERWTLWRDLKHSSLLIAVRGDVCL